ncbi:MAG: tetratricopeptide repeat protein, partial [Planctomycetes bacterium]|nr:tetratricopeptide repeat protein [Planctomycetota bacterium]
MAKGRFSNLEFGDGGEAPAPAATAPRAEQPFASQLKDADYYLRQAEAQELEGSHDAALRSFSAALGENPLLLDAWVGQLRMLLELGEYPEARLWADKALEKFPNHAQVLAAKS